MIAACVVSSLNDVLTKYLGGRLPAIEISFFRFFFGALLLWPFFMIRGKKTFGTNYLTVHIIRSFLLILAMTAWSYGVIFLPLTLSTVISFTTPLFILPLAAIFLGEYCSWQRSAATFLGFVGVAISLYPIKDNFNSMTVSLLGSTILFALLDIINKKLLIENEDLLSMLFYSAIGTAILGVVPTLLMWITPTFEECFFLLLLSGGSMLILFCLLSAFSSAEISSLQPFRYTEFIFSGICGGLIFRESPKISIFFGMTLIVLSTFYIAIHEINQRQKI